MAREPDEATTPSNEMQRSRRFDKCRSHEHQKTLNERSFCVYSNAVAFSLKSKQYAARSLC